MKKSITLILVFVSMAIYAQTDKIILRDYSIIDAVVTKVSEDQIEYSFPNESLVNSLKTSKIVRIEFGSGRVQNFDAVSSKQERTQPLDESPQEYNQPIDNQTPQSQSQGYQLRPVKQNTIAILPIPFLDSETLASSEEMSKFAQNDMYNKLMEVASNIFPLVVQDLRVTNSLLRKAGVDYKNIDEILIEDLQNILGVDNIIAAKVSYIKRISQYSVSSSNTKIDEHEDDDDAEVKTSNFSSQNTDISFDYTVYFDLYKNSVKTYTRTRQPFFSYKDSWMDSMSYLLKRSPVYSR